MKLRSKWCLIGIPDHQAVIHVGGRIGAARGPLAFRQALSRLRHIQASLVLDQDVLNLGKNVAQNHRLAADAVRNVHAGEAPLSVVVGGGHDHGYSHLLGLREALLQSHPTVRLGCINIDAHLDVRKPSPLITSGSPFYLALENGVIQGEDFVEFGIQDQSNTPELFEYARSRKATIVDFRDLRHGKAIQIFNECLKRLSARCDAVAISLDLDAAASAYAPGVSAPQAEGFTPTDLFEMMEIAGGDPKVHSLGIFELNPEHDIDQRTALLGATAAYQFIAKATGLRV